MIKNIKQVDAKQSGMMKGHVYKALLSKSKDLSQFNQVLSLVSDETKSTLSKTFNQIKENI